MNKLHEYFSMQYEFDSLVRRQNQTDKCRFREHYCNKQKKLSDPYRVSIITTFRKILLFTYDIMMTKTSLVCFSLW
jgi:hypothetical protein